MGSDGITKQPDALNEIKQMLLGLDSRFAGFEARLAALENKVDAWLLETRLIWERVLAEIAETRHEMGEVRHEVAEMHQEMREGFDRMADKVAVLSESDVDIRGELRNVRRRMDRLEGKP